MNISNSPIDLDNLIDEADIDDLLDAAQELRAMGMHTLATSVERAHGMLLHVEAPPASGTFAVTATGARLVPRASMGV